MLKIDKVNNSLVVEGLDNKLFPDNGKLSVPLNSILLVLDESNIVTFRSASNNNVFFSANINNIRISGESVTKENIVSKFDAVSNAASGGGGGDVDVDTEILPNSTNPVENRAIYEKTYVTEEWQTMDSDIFPIPVDIREGERDIKLRIDLSKQYEGSYNQRYFYLAIQVNGNDEYVVIRIDLTYGGSVTWDFTEDNKYANALTVVAFRDVTDYQHYIVQIHADTIEGEEMWFGYMCFGFFAYDYIDENGCKDINDCVDVWSLSEEEHVGVEFKDKRDEPLVYPMNEKFAELSDNGPELANNPSLYKSEDGVLGTRFKKYDIVNGRYIGDNGTFKEILKYNPDHFSYFNDGLNFTYSIKHLPEPEYVIDNITQEMMPIELEGNPLTEQSSIKINFFDGGMPFGMGSFSLSSGSAMLRFEANKDMHHCSVQVMYEDMSDPESYIVKYFESEEGSLVVDIPLNEFYGLYMDSPIEFMSEWIEEETLDSIVIYTSQGEVIPFSEWMNNTDEAIQAIDVKDEVVSRALNTLNTTKQANLVSGTNIKTINNESILGSGNINISGGVQSDWDEADTTDPSYIQNKPDLSVFANSADLATVATSGDYDDLSNKPFITTVEYDTQNTALVINTVEPLP